MDKAKPFCIPKREVWEAYKRVKANRGAAGLDGQSIARFEQDLRNNLYRIWNRMSSGSYFPPPVLRVEIPKDNGAGVRPLGIPTVSDRIALPRAEAGGAFPRGLLWLPTRAFGARCLARGAAAMLEIRLGARSGHQILFR